MGRRGVEHQQERSLHHDGKAVSAKAAAPQQLRPHREVTDIEAGVDQQHCAQVSRIGRALTATRTHPAYAMAPSTRPHAAVCRPKPRVRGDSEQTAPTATDPAAQALSTRASCSSVVMRSAQHALFDAVPVEVEECEVLGTTATALTAAVPWPSLTHPCS